jgi:hypothetical protein
MNINNKEYHRFLSDNDYQTKSACSPVKILAILPESVRHYWWRGYFDGDGSFNLQPTCAGICVAAPYEQDLTFFEKLCQDLGVHFKIHRWKRRCGNVSCLLIRRKHSVIAFCEYIYAGQRMGLERKRVKYEEYKSRYPNETST